jgi:hypothetical protein
VELLQKCCAKCSPEHRSDSISRFRPDLHRLRCRVVSFSTQWTMPIKVGRIPIRELIKE